MPNQVILRGDQYTAREDLSSKNITPGYLLDFDSNGQLIPHATQDGKSARIFAVEDAIIGYDATKQYLSGDRVQYADCAAGMVVYAHLASGNLIRGQFLSSAGDGTLHLYAGSAPPVAQLDENADASAGVVRFRARVL